jgi:uncharacterized repeat protein (TIGR03803 family)
MILKKIFVLVSIFFLNLALIMSQIVPDFYGVTRKGGINNAGVIYKADNEINGYEVVYNFNINDGKEPTFTDLTEFNNKFYGCTRYGGTYATGTIFVFDPNTNEYSKIIDMNNTIGSQPWGSLVMAGNQKLYGLARYGGNLQKGTIYEFDPTTGNTIKKIDFDGSNKGGEPVGSLCLGNDGMLYGMTSIGGIYGQGVLFKYDPDQDFFTKLHDFGGFGYGDGAQPKSDLIQASDGKIYGTTTYGGAYDQGSIFQYDITTSIYTVKHSFLASSTGKNPWAGKLVEYPDGKLWGATIVGGTWDFGVIYNYILSSGSVTKIYNFTGGANGENPGSSLVIGNDNLLYGVTQKGGSNNTGIVFSINPSNYSFSKKLSFNGSSLGSTPYGGLFKGSDELIYGLTSAGGIYNSGVLYQYSNITNTLVKKHDFGYVGNGFNPAGDLVMTGRDTLYGLTTYGGTQSGGVIFELDINSNTFKKKFDLSNYYGVFPLNGFCLASNELLYATASEGGVSNKGTFFEYNKKTNTIVRYPFSDIDGAFPNSKVSESSNGKLYGMTNKGGDFNKGLLFEFDPLLKILKKVFSFDGPNNGSFPEGDFVERNGILYGLTTKGGSNDKGIIFSYDPVLNSFIKLYEFSGSDGENPANSLTEKNGILYGVCQKGGINDQGIIFKYDILNSQFTKIFNFESTTTGAFPNGKLRFSSENSLNGSTEKGGLNDKGTLFKYDLNTNIFEKKLDFDGINGEGPYHSGLGKAKSRNNNFCYGAEKLKLGQGYCDNLFLDQNLEAINSKTLPQPNCISVNGSDKWYKLIVPPSGKINIEMSRIGSFIDGALAVYTGSCQSLVLLDCDDDSNNYPGNDLMPQKELIGLIPGEQLFLRVWSKNNQKHGEYSVCAWEKSEFNISEGGLCINGVPTVADEFFGNLYTWIPIKDDQGKIISFVYPNGNQLGNITSKIFTRDAIPLRFDGDFKPYINRDIQIIVENQPDDQGSLVRLCYTDTEVQDLLASTDPQYTYSDINMTKNELDCSGEFLSPGIFFEQKKNDTLNSNTIRYFDFDVPSFSTFYLHGGTVVLPLDLLYFQVEYKGDFNFIKWEFENINSLNSVTLQKSVTDLRDWFDISLFEIQKEQKFQYYDYDFIGKNYYRLKFMDENGKISYSKIINIEFNQNKIYDIQIFPNPAFDILKIKLDNQIDISGNLIIYNNLGFPVFNEIFKGNELEINVQDYKAGIYYLYICQDKDFKNKKFIIEHK